MALEATLKYGVQRIAQTLRDYAAAHGWSDGDYKVFVRLNMDWNRIHVLLVAKAFPRNDTKNAWLSVWAFLQDRLKDEPALVDCLNLVVRTFDQVTEGGRYAIGPKYVEINDLLRTGPIEDSHESLPFSTRSRG